MTEAENQIRGQESEIKGTLPARQVQLAADLAAIAARTNELNSPFKGDLLKHAEASPDSEAITQELPSLEVGRVVFNRDSGNLYTVVSIGGGIRPGDPVVVLEGQDGARFTTKASRLSSILASKGGAWHY
jgi:hypothetical protein